jgi:hypothetical protein
VWWLFLLGVITRQWAQCLINALIAEVDFGARNFTDFATSQALIGPFQLSLALKGIFEA